MADDPHRVPLPDELPIRLDHLQELFAAAHRAMLTIEATVGRDDASYARLDRALGQISADIMRRLGFWTEE